MWEILLWRRGEEAFGTQTYYRQVSGREALSFRRLWAIFLKVLQFLEKIDILMPLDQILLVFRAI